MNILHQTHSETKYPFLQDISPKNAVISPKALKRLLYLKLCSIDKLEYEEKFFIHFAKTYSVFKQGIKKASV